MKKHRQKRANLKGDSVGFQFKGVAYKSDWKTPNWLDLLGQSQEASVDSQAEGVSNAFYALGRADDNIFKMVHRRYQTKRDLLLSDMDVDSMEIATQTHTRAFAKKSMPPPVPQRGIASVVSVQKKPIPSRQEKISLVDF